MLVRRCLPKCLLEPQIGTTRLPVQSDAPRAAITEDQRHLQFYLGFLLYDPPIRICRGEKERPKVIQTFLKLSQSCHNGCRSIPSSSNLVHPTGAFSCWWRYPGKVDCRRQHSDSAVVIADGNLGYPWNQRSCGTLQPLRTKPFNKYSCHHLRAIPAMVHPHFFSANLTVDLKRGYICIVFTFFFLLSHDFWKLRYLKRLAVCWVSH